MIHVFEFSDEERNDCQPAETNPRQKQANQNCHEVGQKSSLVLQHCLDLKEQEPEKTFSYIMFFPLLSFINPRRACAARVTVVGLCVCVCVSVRDYSRTTGYEAAYERYQKL